MNKQFNCPCCGMKTLEEKDFYCICDICGWEDDPGQSANPDDSIGANEVSLNRHRALWQQRQMIINQSLVR